MARSRVSDIKHAQRESFLSRELSSLFVRIAADEPQLQSMSITRAQFAADRSTIVVYFYMSEGIEVFREKMGTLILYKPSLRAALAKAMPSRYTPNIKFVYDELFEEQCKVNKLIDRLKDEGRL